MQLELICGGRGGSGCSRCVHPRCHVPMHTEWHHTRSITALTVHTCMHSLSNCVFFTLLTLIEMDDAPQLPNSKLGSTGPCPAWNHWEDGVAHHQEAATFVAASSPIFCNFDFSEGGCNNVDPTTWCFLFAKKNKPYQWATQSVYLWCVYHIFKWQ